MAVDPSSSSVGAAPSVSSGRLDLSTLTAGRIVEGRVMALSAEAATLATRQGVIDVALGSGLKPAVGDVLRFEVRAVGGRDGGSQLQLALLGRSADTAPTDTNAAVTATASLDAAQRALGGAVARAAAGQSGLAPLYATLSGLASAPQGSVPDPVRALVNQLLGSRLAANRMPSGADVARAFGTSGLFLEAALAAGASGDPVAAGDLKATLAGLRDALTRWVAAAPANGAAATGTVAASGGGSAATAGSGTVASSVSTGGTVTGGTGSAGAGAGDAGTGGVTASGAGTAVAAGASGATMPRGGAGVVTAPAAGAETPAGETSSTSTAMRGSDVSRPTDAGAVAARLAGSAYGAASARAAGLSGAAPAETSARAATVAYGGAPRGAGVLPQPAAGDGRIAPGSTGVAPLGTEAGAALPVAPPTDGARAGVAAAAAVQDGTIAGEAPGSARTVVATAGSAGSGAAIAAGAATVASSAAGPRDGVADAASGAGGGPAATAARAGVSASVATVSPPTGSASASPPGATTASGSGEARTAILAGAARADGVAAAIGERAAIATAGGSVVAVSGLAPSTATVVAASSPGDAKGGAPAAGSGGLASTGGPPVGGSSATGGMPGAAAGSVGSAPATQAAGFVAGSAGTSPGTTLDVAAATQAASGAAATVAGSPPTSTSAGDGVAGDAAVAGNGATGGALASSAAAAVSVVASAGGSTVPAAVVGDVSPQADDGRDAVPSSGGPGATGGAAATGEPEAGGDGPALLRAAMSAALPFGADADVTPETAAAVAAGRSDLALRPPPPRKGRAPQAQAALPAESVAAGGAEALGRRALARTEGALQRILLEQFAVIDGNDAASAAAGASQGTASGTSSGAAAGPAARPAREWTAELPLATGAGTSIVQMTIERDASRGGGSDAGAVGWRVRFAMDVEPIGPVHAQIGLVGERLSVGLWIERPEMAARLAEGVGALSGALAGLDLPIEAVHVAQGEPPAPNPGRPSGRHFVDVSL